MLTKPMKQGMLDQLMRFFEQNGWKSTKITNNQLIADGEKLIWIPRPRIEGKMRQSDREE